MRAILIWLSAIACACAMAGDIDALIERVLPVIAQVESNHNDAAVGDNGKALGRYQIHACYVADVNRIAKASYTHTSAHDGAIAACMVRVYLRHYARRYERLTGLVVDAEALCRMHNGGPNGYKKPCTLPYWEKCRKLLKE